MSKPYMTDIYKYLLDKEGKRIGNAAFDGDALCQEILKRYRAHRDDNKSQEKATELRKVLQQYTNLLRNELGHWPANTPASLRVHTIEVVDVYSMPPG